MSQRTVTLLSHDLTGNALSRAYMLAKLLQSEYRVRIVGYAEKDDLWAPVRNDNSIEYRRFHIRSALGLWIQTRRIVRRLIDGDLIVAVKPMHATLRLGLTARRLLGRPLLLDIDDWELGFLSDSLYWEARLLGGKWVWSATSPLYTRLADRLIRKADAITVSSRFLQERYGGTWIGQARDESLFSRENVQALPGDGNKVVMFLGSAREHKGLHDLLVAWKQVRIPGAVLKVIGTPLDSPLIRSLQAHADGRVRFEGLVPFEKVPAILASASVFVLPQKPGRASIGQVPMKLIDAMALGCPIVATAVGDIPDWLDGGAGLVVPPDAPSALGEAIDHLLAQPKEADRLGACARARFLRYGSFTSVRQRLLPLVASLIARQTLPRPFAPFASDLPPFPSLVSPNGPAVPEICGDLSLR